MRTVVGIDPGRYGALAHVRLDDMAVLDLVDMPLETGPTGKTAPDPRAIYGLLQRWQPGLVVLEHVQPMGRQAPSALWTFAEGFGELLAACKLFSGAERRVTLVRPARWKELLQLSSNKEQSLELARKLFPEVTDMLSRARDDGRAEALLLTAYHRKFVVPAESVEVY